MWNKDKVEYSILQNLEYSYHFPHFLVVSYTVVAIITVFDCGILKAISGNRLLTLQLKELENCLKGFCNRISVLGWVQD